MTTLSLGLLLLSALSHSTWNLLLKRSENTEVFAWWLLVSGSVVFLPLGGVLLWFNSIDPAGWWLVLATVLLHSVYFSLLGRGYASGDLSLVYPIARGMGPMLVPVLAVLLLGESIHVMAMAGIVAIVIGIYTVSWWGSFGRLFREPLAMVKHSGTRYAILTGFTIAAYALVDKQGVAHVQPFLYMYLLNVGSALCLAPYILIKESPAAIRREWRENAGPILAASVLAFLAYGLVLTAFSLSRVSYVAPAREVGIVAGVLMGVFILKEPFGAGRILGSCLIVAGLALIALSP